MKRLLAWFLCLAALLTLGSCGKKAEEGWVFRVNGVSMTLGEGCADALASLQSECRSQNATGSCWKDTGEDVIYQYDGFRLKTYRTKSGDPNETLLAVEFTTDEVKTPEGITVGSTLDAVKAAYGTPTEEDSSSVTYDRGNTRLRFSLRDGNVTGVNYLTL